MPLGTELSIRGLYRQFGEKSVLRGIDLDIRPGEFVAIVGKSGSGKSTLLRLIAGLDTPSTGDLEVEGQPLSGLNTAARVMFQDARLLPWKHVLDNIGLGLRGNWQPRAKELLGQVGLSDRAREWPGVLSGGERQRVALARALVSHPTLLLLDEPLGALDALTRIEMQGVIERLWLTHRFTAVLITHDIEEAIALGDRVALIEDGRITLDEPVLLPRPRPRGSPEFAALKDRILHRVLGDSPLRAAIPFPITERVEERIELRPFSPDRIKVPTVIIPTHGC